MTVLLLDGTQLAYRSYYAFVRNPLHNSSGEETSVTFAFVNTLLRLLQRYEPTYAAVVFDAPGKKFRHELDERYKEGRPPMPDGMSQQLPRLRETLDALRLPMLQIDGYEADDILGTLARRFEANAESVLLVTNDKDFQQLLTERVRMLCIQRTGGDIDEFGPIELQTKLGITPQQVVDYMSLCGDSVDNIPGVPGVGVKTAQTLIREHGSLDAVYEHLPQITSAALRRKLEAGRDSARRSRELLQIVTDVELDLEVDSLRLPQPDWQRVRDILRQLEFFGLLRNLPVESVPGHEATCEVIEDLESLQRFAVQLRQRDAYAIHVETIDDPSGGTTPYAVAFAWSDSQATMLRLHVPGPQLSLGSLGLESDIPGELDRDAVHAVLADSLHAPEVRKIVHDVKQLVRGVTEGDAWLGAPWFDTMLAAYVLNPGRRTHGLDALATEFLDHTITTRDALFERKDRQRDLRQVPVASLARYMGDRATATWSLADRFRQRLDAETLGAIYDDIEIPLLSVLIAMETAGVRVDLAFLARLSDEFEHAADGLAERIYELAGERFNIQSPRQLGEILFERLGLAHGRRTKTGWSTDSDVLERLSAEHELPRVVLEYRQLTKLRSTYTDALPKLVRSSSGRIHTTFNQAVASTGRLSSSEPNLQNIPTRSEIGRRIREAFVPDDDGARLLSADYSQIELRIMAHLSQDRVLVQAFRDAVDVHTLTAARIANCDPSAVSGHQRAAAKTVNFGVIYGMGARGLAQQLAIPLEEARRFIEEYFASYPGVRVYTQKMVERARREGFVATLLGRKLALPDLKSSHPAQRAAAERIAVNAPIQGSAADIIKRAMVRVHARIQSEGLRSRMILQVHDELVFDAPQDEVEVLEPLVRYEMENAMHLSVPLVVDVGVGRNWVEAH